MCEELLTFLVVICWFPVMLVIALIKDEKWKPKETLKYIKQKFCKHDYEVSKFYSLCGSTHKTCKKCGKIIDITAEY